MNKRRLIFIVTISLVAAIVVCWFIFMRGKAASALQVMPENVIACFEINNRAEFETMVSDDIWQELGGLQLLNELTADYQLLKEFCSTDKDLAFDFDHEQLLAGVFITSAGQVDYLFVLDLNEAKRINLSSYQPLINGESSQNGEHVFEKQKIYDLVYPGNLHISCARSADILMFSSSAVLVESAVFQLKNGSSLRDQKGFADVYANCDASAPFNAFIQLKEFTEYLSMFMNAESTLRVTGLQHYCSWLGLQFKTGEDGITINGYASPSMESGNALISMYDGETYQSVIDLIPAGTVVLYQVNAGRLSENISSQLNDEKLNLTFFDYWAPWMETHYTFGITESIDEEYSKKYFVIIPASDTVLAKNKLRPLIVQDTIWYKGYHVMELNGGKVLSAITGSSFQPVVYGTHIRNNFIFTNELNQLNTMIDAVEYAQTLSLSENYKQLADHLTTNFNNSVYINLFSSGDILRSFIPSGKESSFDTAFQLASKFPQLGLQFSRAKDVYLVNGFVTYRTKPLTNSGLIWQAQLDHPVSAGPFTVFDKSTQQYNVLVQDTANQVYLLTGGGNLLWKQMLDQAIIGGVNVVDFYNNNSTQLLFSTKFGIHLLDMKGGEVEGFPIQLTSGSVNPIAMLVVDESQYKMFIACSNLNIYGFGKNGKPLTGWNPMKATARVEKEITPFYSDNMNYLLIPTDKGLVVAYENGKRILSLPSTSDIVSPIAHVQDHIVFANADGSLNSYSIDGAFRQSIKIATEIISANFFDINEDGTTDLLYIDAGGFHARTLTDSVLFDLDLADPRMHIVVVAEINGKQFPGLVSIASGKTFLFNADGSLRTGFPVAGSRPFIVSPVSGGRQHMLITGYNNFIYAYRIE